MACLTSYILVRLEEQFDSMGVIDLLYIPSMTCLKTVIFPEHCEVLGRFVAESKVSR